MIFNLFSGSESLASALQNEIERRRKAAANDSTRNSPVRNVPKKPELKFSKPMPAGMVKNDRHDQVKVSFCEAIHLRFTKSSFVLHIFLVNGGISTRSSSNVCQP